MTKTVKPAQCSDIPNGAFSVAFLTRQRLYRLGIAVTFGLAVVIAILTLAPVSAQDVPGSDKLHHVLGFAALAFPLSFARPRLALWVVLGVSAYGGLIELIQPYFGRHAEWGDFLADFLGASLGAGAGALCGFAFRRMWFGA